MMKKIFATEILRKLPMNSAAFFISAKDMVLKNQDFRVWRSASLPRRGGALRSSSKRRNPIGISILRPSMCLYCQAGFNPIYTASSGFGNSGKQYNTQAI